MTTEFARETELLLDVAVLGEEMDKFWRSPIGRYLQECIEREAGEGMRALRDADCNDARAVWDAQSRIKRAESVREWVTESITAGLKAQQVLEDREDD